MMYCIPLLCLLSTAYFAQAAPAPPLSPPSFYLVATSQKESSSSSSTLADVSALSLFSPYYQPNYLLRTIKAGYGSLPVFTIEDGRLHTTSSGPHGIGTFVFNSTDVVEGTELQFLAHDFSRDGGLALEDGYLLTVGGDKDGWGVYPGLLAQTVIIWKGDTASKVYIHAVLDAPY